MTPTQPGLVPLDQIHAADTAWMMTATALVLLMTLPGIALFYAGMVRRKNVLNTMASVIAVAALVTVLWYGVGYSLAFTPGNGFLGGTGRLWFAGLDYARDAGRIAVSHIAPQVPESVYSMFQLAFAIITPALIVGAFVERMRFSAMLWFTALWSLLVYVPVAHWVWEPGGWLAQRGALDFAGGTVVHINAGIAGLVCAWMLGPRTGYGREPFEPFNLGLTMTGTGLLWVGWFGFNAGSAVASDGRAGLAFAVTHIAAAGGALAWMAGEWVMRRRPSLLGLCSGAVGGLVAITPASGFVGPRAALAIGLIAGLACYWGATGLKRLLQADDALDVFGVHGIGGIVGCLLTGVFADPVVGGAEGNVLVQALSAVAVLGYGACGTALVLWITRLLVGLRVDEVAEQHGLDIAQHRERIGG
ncbi:ammonium transporter [uncultured Xylophilus sp.]|uniref:ammonium transporter n=1 Tax=uncultured Xylophilus sp. TaxID=296832 RepID=UPI0025E8BC7F|nr:ammonium transporter [uncultured Xylophilus sp.]